MLVRFITVSMSMLYGLEHRAIYFTKGKENVVIAFWFFSVLWCAQFKRESFVMHNFSHRCHYSMLLSGFLKKKLLWEWKAKVLQQLRIIKIGHFIKKVTYGPGLLKGSFTRMMLLCLQNYKIIISLINILFHKDFRFLKFENFCSKHASKRVGWIDLKKSLKFLLLSL